MKVKDFYLDIKRQLLWGTKNTVLALTIPLYSDSMATFNSLTFSLHLSLHNLTNRVALWSYRLLWSVTNREVAVSREGGYVCWCSLKSREAFHVEAEEPKTCASFCVCLPSKGSQRANVRALTCLSKSTALTQVILIHYEYEILCSTLWYWETIESWLRHSLGGPIKSTFKVLKTSGQQVVTYIIHSNLWIPSCYHTNLNCAGVSWGLLS